MPDYDELSHNFQTAAAQDLRPLVAEAAEALAVDQAETEQLGYFLTKAWMAGAHAGQVEVVAQAREKGFDVDIQMVRAPRGKEEDES